MVKFDWLKLSSNNCRAFYSILRTAIKLVQQNLSGENLAQKWNSQRVAHDEKLMWMGVDKGVVGTAILYHLCPVMD